MLFYIEGVERMIKNINKVILIQYIIQSLFYEFSIYS